jgi:hypothetical protein
MKNTSGDRTMTRILIGIVGVWFMAAFLGGVADIFHQPSVPPINVGLFLVVPIAGFLIAYAASTRVRRAINGIPLWWITIAHVWRFVGIVFVLGALVFQVIPLQFGIPEGFGDIIAAVFAIPLALALRRNRRPRSTGRTMPWLRGIYSDYSISFPPSASAYFTR